MLEKMNLELIWYYLCQSVFNWYYLIFSLSREFKWKKEKKKKILPKGKEDTTNQKHISISMI